MKRLLRVLVAEDSILTRKLLVMILEADPLIKVVGVAKNGQEVVDLARRLRPDVITMDIRMPVMDGFQATRIIMSENPTPILVISSSIGNEDLKISFNAIQAGALDIVEKPRGNLKVDYGVVGAEIIKRVKLISEIRVFRHLSPRISVKDTWSGASREDRVEGMAVAIGASTGGPSALLQLFQSAPADFPAPIFVTQHISEGFGKGCAEWLGRNTALTVKVAERGEKILPSVVYFAPDQGLLEIHDTKELSIRARLSHQERFSIDTMMVSVAKTFREKSIGVLLTGMGSDGVRGLQRIKEMGGKSLVQDRQTSIVFGMPKAAIEAGAADKVLPLEDIFPYLMRSVTKSGAAR